jgi:hypothetical protein
MGRVHSTKNPIAEQRETAKPLIKLKFAVSICFMFRNIG